MSQILRGRDWARRLQARLAADAAAPADWMVSHTAVIKRDAHSLVGLFTLDDRPCYLKFYQSKHGAQRLLLRFGRGRGVASFDNALALRRAGLDVPEPLACVGVNGGLLLLTEAVEQAADLKQLWLQSPGEPQLQQLMATAGRTLARWHTHGFTHGDAKWSNFLFAGDRLLLVDLEGVGRGTPTGQGARRDLARFVVNAEDMGLAQAPFETFLEHYAAGVGIDAAALPARIRPRLEALRRRHRARYGQRGRQLIP